MIVDQPVTRVSYRKHPLVKRLILGLAAITRKTSTNFSTSESLNSVARQLSAWRAAMIGGVIHGLFITFLPAILVPMLESYRSASAGDSVSATTCTGLVLGCAWARSRNLIVTFSNLAAADHQHGP
ncbi:hypothetical protein [Klebsiella pneumoniae]|uniref:hypothetical protein n=1 Tax=Klebsiella pneumoniae TaxID=573 RepID=UPI003987015A